MDFGLKDIIQSISLLGSIIGLAWYLRGTIAGLHHDIARIEAQLDAIETIKDELRDGRKGRAALHNKIDDITGRIIRLETKMKMTRTS